VIIFCDAASFCRLESIKNDFNVKRKLLKCFNVIWGVQMARKKYSVSQLPQIKAIIAPSRLPEGRFAIVTNVRRDAMDADAPLTNGAEADGEVVWS
jgi:hypothetical protein